MYGGPQLSRQNQKRHGNNKIPHGKPENLTEKTKRQNQSRQGKTKDLTAKPNTSQQKPNTSRQKQIPTAKPKLFCFCGEVFGFAVRFLVLPWGILFLPWGFWFCRDSCGSPYKCSITRGTQLEYSSKPLKHSIVKRILVLNGRYIYPLKMFHLFAFPSWKSNDPKIIGIKTYLFENFSQKKRSPKF